MKSVRPDNPNRFAGVALNVASPNGLASFYVDHLGMTMEQTNGVVRLRYAGSGNGGASIELRPAASEIPYSHNKLDEYWKIGITLPNVDIAYEQLSRSGIKVTRPNQFQDIGYMCHLADPDGFQIELLQHTFEGQNRTVPGDTNLPLGGGAQIGQITLRVSDIDRALAYYQVELGMRLQSKQVVEGRGFTLYFLAFTDETPLDENIEAVVNRPWLWQRPYTTLELQHVPDATQSIRSALAGDTGYAGLLIEDLAR